MKKPGGPSAARSFVAILGLCAFPAQAEAAQASQPAKPVAAAAVSATPRIALRENWSIVSSAEVRATGAAISTPGFRTHDWYRATVPCTVLGALVQQRVYADPGVGMNLRSIAGVTYPIFSNFSNAPMPPDSPYRSSWWYRTEFTLPAAYQGKTVVLPVIGPIAQQQA